MLKLLVLLLGAAVHQANAAADTTQVQEYDLEAKDFAFALDAAWTIGSDTINITCSASATISTNPTTLADNTNSFAGNYITAAVKLQSKNSKGIVHNMSVSVKTIDAANDGDCSSGDFVLASLDNVAANYKVIGVLKTTPVTVKETKFEIDESSTETVVYVQQDSATDLAAGKHLFGCGAVTGSQAGLDKVDFKNDSSSTIDIFLATVSSTTDTGKSSEHQFFKVTLGDTWANLSTLCVNTNEFFWVGAGATTADAAFATYENLGTFTNAANTVTPNSDHFHSIHATDGIKIKLNKGTAASDLTLLLGCHTGTNTRPSTIFRGTLTSTSGTEYNITQFGETAGNRLAELDSTNCIHNNRLVASVDGGQRWEIIATLKTDVITCSTVQEYKTDSKDWAFALDYPDQVASTDFYVYCATSDPSADLTAADTIQLNGTVASNKHTQDNKGVVAVNIDLAATATSCAADDKIYIGTHDTVWETYVQIGVVKATVNSPMASQAFDINPASNNNVFYMQGAATNGQISAGVHLFGCGTYTTDLKSTDFDTDNSNASVDIFPATVGYTVPLEATTHTNATSAANEAYYSVTLKDSLSSKSTLSLLCADTKTLFWVGAGGATTTADMGQVALGTFDATPITITAATNNKVHTTVKAGVEYTLSAADTTATIIAGCTATETTTFFEPNIIMKVTASLVSGTTSTYEVSKFGTASTSKALNVLDPVACIDGNRLVMSRDGGFTWVQVGYLSVPSASDAKTVGATLAAGAAAVAAATLI